MIDFLEMGGYARFVWPAYAATLVVLSALIWRTTTRNAAVREELAQLEARARRKQRAEDEAQAETRADA